MSFEKLLVQARKIWGDKPQTLEHITICLGKVYGDIAEQARSQIEIGKYDKTEVEKEFGNLIFSTIRWADDLGLDIENCLRLAVDSQVKYKKAK